ncbi:MAG: NAD(P)-binding protein, partial [Deltaproteobacteria bacterium]|nr:NAD(P)-binding protein [Deltaproteobacteria bacterium]
MRDGWDAIIVGSGAAGGWAARELAAHDLRVLVLEAGGAAPADAPAPRRGRHPVQSKCYAFDDGTRGLFVDDLDNPYTTPADAPFDWIRARTVGGRMRVWDRVCLRMSERDFSAGWPIAYTELAPYYDEVERAIGVCGRADGIAAVPDGRFVAPPPLGPLAAHLQAALAARGALAQVTPMRRA